MLHRVTAVAWHEVLCKWLQAASGAWWAAATQLLERATPNSGGEVAAYVRDTLSESDR